MNVDLNLIIPIVAIVLYAALYIVVAISRPQNTMRRRFRLFLLTMLVWSSAAYLTLIDIGATAFWFRLMTASALASMLTLFYFTQAVIRNPLKRWSTVIYMFSFGTIIIGLFTNLLIKEVAMIEGELFYKFHPLVPLVAGPSYLVVFLSLVQLFTSAKASQDETQITRYTILTLAVVVVVIGGALNFTELGKYPVDIAANVLAALLFTYSILRHQLLDIRVVIRRSVLYFIPTVIIGAAYFLVLTLTLLLFNAETRSELYFIALIISLFAAIIIQPLRDSMQDWVDRFFFRERYSEVMMLQRISQTASSVIDIDKLSNFILEEVAETIHIKKAALFLKNENQKNYFLNSQIGIVFPPRTKINTDHPLINLLKKDNSIIGKQELETNPIFRSMWSDERKIFDDLEVNLVIPLSSAGDLLGLIFLGPKLSEQPYSSQDRQILLTLSQQTAVAVNNAQLYSVSQRELVQRRETEKSLQLQLKRLSALQNINIAITTNIDLQIPLYLLLEQVTDELNVDAADVLLLDEESQQLIFVAGQGFKTDALRYTKLDMGEGLAGQAAENGEVIHIENLNDESTSLLQSPTFKEEEFVAYFGVPLITKGKVKGVLEVFHRSKLSPDKDWKDFLNTLTSETAIAVDNAQMFRDLEKSNLDLAVAYDTTLEGWARTLELRDRETEGHSQRVMDLTLRLSRKLGIAEEEIIHVHRGALLHDIGKMGVPDSILFKPGSLTKKEWAIMQQHPVFAYEMLSAIPFLEKAIDIPYCHHEKWNGSGYPRGLHGEEIPLSARIFAVVDVWDALRSDRPYRKAWSDDKALEEIKKGKGTHFDPVVVETFLEFINFKQRTKRLSKVESV